jgi:malonyl-CoA O-methyltransferase
MALTATTTDRRLLARLASGLRRRLCWLRWRLTGDRPTAVEAAFAWLFGPETAEWVPDRVGGDHGCPATTRAAIAVAMDYGMFDRARRWQAWLDAHADANAETAVSEDAGLAALAIACYEQGRRAEGDRAMRRLARRGPRPGQSARSVIYYLQAALLQVRTAFEHTGSDLPDAIDPTDGRMQAVRHWAGQLPPGAKLADVGCGKGRFLERLAAACPELKLIGIDPAASMLAALPAGIERRPGSLLAIPAADGEFDAALAVESLEHALVPSRAVEELCRVVRPGGRVLIIDKHRARQALSEHEPWERWFWPQELAAWLGRFCDEVQVESVSHREGRPGEDLFLAAAGVVVSGEW